MYVSNLYDESFDNYHGSQQVSADLRINIDNKRLKSVRPAIPIPKGLSTKQAIDYFNISPDGNCGYRAIAHVIFDDEASFGKIALTKNSDCTLEEKTLRTAHYWFKKKKDADQRRIQQPQLAQEQEKKRVGRPKILNEEHKRFLLEKYSEDPRATINEAMESLTSQFEELKIAKTAVHNFMINDRALTIKKAHFEP
ncbi:hypothetical protein BD560DRAFT_440058 [Blakeslea trispora]|nr:hypothetical protein BD560DRAFT_440058 [Blakeslea trispora]